MARVVMLTAAAGADLDLQYGDIFETDQASADRLISLLSAREVTAEDKDAPVKRDPALLVGRETSRDGAATVESEDENRDGGASRHTEEPTEEAKPVRRPSVRRR